MTIYDALYWLVTIVGIAAACGAVYLVHLIWTVHLSTGSLHAWLDKASDEYADYMEWERDRRNENSGESALRYYGLNFLVERALFRIQYDLACALYKRRLGFRSDEDAGFQEV